MDNEKTLRESLAAGFDTAYDDAAEEVAAESSAEGEETVQQAEEQASVEETPASEPEQVPVQETVQATPEVQTEGNNPVDVRYQQMMQLIQQQQAMIQQLTQQNQQQNQAMQQQSQLAEETVNESLAPEPYPQFDYNAVRYLDADAQNRAMMQWQQAVIERATKDAVAQAMGQMAPIREQYEANRRVAENDAARTAVFSDPRFSDFGDRRESIEGIISHMTALQGLDPTTRYTVAGLMDRGLRHASQPTTEEILEMARNNPDVMRAIAVQQANEVAQANAQVPKIAASTGMAQANAIPEKRPANKKELREFISKRLG